MAGGLIRAVDRFDQRVDAHLETWRGNRVADRLFYAASWAGDHGRIWMVLAILRFFTGVGGTQAAQFAGIRAVCAEVGQSIVVNLGIKSFFRRTRPLSEAPRPYGLRMPRTTSFPSGHATAAFCAVVLLSQGTPWGPGLFVLAVIVALSRAYVRIHHASDVVGGVVIGLAIGIAVAYLVPLP